MSHVPMNYGSGREYKRELKKKTVAKLQEFRRSWKKDEKGNDRRGRRD